MRSLIVTTPWLQGLPLIDVHIRRWGYTEDKSTDFVSVLFQKSPNSSCINNSWWGPFWQTYKRSRTWRAATCTTRKLAGAVTPPQMDCNKVFQRKHWWDKHSLWAAAWSRPTERSDGGNVSRAKMYFPNLLLGLRVQLCRGGTYEWNAEIGNLNRTKVRWVISWYKRFDQHSKDLWKLKWASQETAKCLRIATWAAGSRGYPLTSV